MFGLLPQSLELHSSAAAAVFRYANRPQIV